jgi:bacillithiol biosynthesis cysteine-adding enzyme BshC
VITRSYTLGKTIERATFELVNELFSDFGLVILLPDNQVLKKQFIPVMEKEIKEQFSHKQVSETIASFPNYYKAKVGGRDINLFHLEDDTRERVETNGDGYMYNVSRFTRSEIIDELYAYPERFSPNVVLRPVYQEMILPSVAFIGGGAEVSYWLELKGVFKMAAVPFPMLVLRNSFMIINGQAEKLINNLQLKTNTLFHSGDEIIKSIVTRKSGELLNLENERTALINTYKNIGAQAAKADPTLQKHVSALEVKCLRLIDGLEKKMLRAEKRKFEAEDRQVRKLKKILFPGSILQERTDNYIQYHAKWGKNLINALYEYSSGLEQKFCVLTKSDHS